MIAVNAKPICDETTLCLNSAARYFTRGKPRAALAVMFGEGNVYILRKFLRDSTNTMSFRNGDVFV